MAVFRVERTKDYTVMSNHHFKNRTLSYRAVGLLSVMLSVPENWDFTLAGLSTLHAESIDAVRTALSELEKAGYVERHRIRNEKGQLKETEYIIREYPILKKPTLDNPMLADPRKAEPIKDEPALEKPTELSTYELSTDQSNTYPLNTKGLNPVSFWKEIKERLSVHICSVSMQTWFDECTPVSFNGSVFTLQADTTFRKAVITRQYTAMIESVMADFIGCEIKLCITSAESDQPKTTLIEE